MAKSADNRPARLFSAYNGNHPINTSELVFDYDPSGKVLQGLRLIAKGIPVQSRALSLADKKYHHLCITYDDGHVQFFADGANAGEAWLPNGAPVRLARVLSAEQVKQVASKGGAAVLGSAGAPHQRAFRNSASNWGSDACLALV